MKKKARKSNHFPNQGPALEISVKMVTAGLEAQFSCFLFHKPV
jgi:hypothetical protein